MPAPNVLFVVHGMGSNLEEAAGPTAWFKEVEKALRDGWNRFPSLKNLSFDKYIELCPLSYDDRFRQYTKRLDENAARLKGKLGESSYMKALAAIAGAGAADEENFLWANVMDVVLYRLGVDFNVEVQGDLQLELAKKVKSVLSARTGTAVQYSMLTHSLGTAVVHGMLQRIALGPIGLSTFFKHDNEFFFRCYMTLANTSRVLFRPEGSIYDRTLIKPGKYVDSFINVSHIADPVPAPMRFAPKTWGAAYREISVQHFRDVNLHAYKHYLDHPAVTGALFRSLVPLRLSEDEIAAVVADYPDVEERHANKRVAIEGAIAAIARELREAYDDETNAFTDTIELLARITRQAWKNRKVLGELV